MARLKDEATLNLHQMLADRLMCLRKHRETLLVAHKGRGGELHGVELLAEEAIDDSAVGKVGPEHKHHREVHTMLSQMFELKIALINALSSLIIAR